MKSGKLFLFFFILSVSLSFNAQSQTIRGSWQLTKQTTCLEGEIALADSTQDLFADMKSRSGAGAQIVKFKEKNQGEESTRILSRKKTANNKNFLYKFDGETLLILDRKSQTIIETYTVDKLTDSELILSGSTRACETRVFRKIKEPKN